MAETVVDIPGNRKVVIISIVSAVVVLSIITALVPATREFIVVAVASLLNLITKII